MNKSITIFSLALIASATLCCCLAKQDVAQAQPQQPMSLQQQARHSLASKLMPKARTARSLSDMFEKVKSKIFGNKKGQTSSSASQSSSSMLASASQQSGAQALNSAQRQPWADINSFNQQYNPYASLSSSNYQWPTSSSGQQSFSGQPSFNSAASLSSLMSAPMQSNYQTIGGSQAGSPMLPGLDTSANQMPLQTGAAGSTSNQGGLLSSASHLIAQYLSPGSSTSTGSAPGSAGSAPTTSALGQSGAQSGGQSSLMTPQQQSQYNEFASILDSMVAQTGSGNSQQRQPSINSQFQGQPNYQPGTGQSGMMGSGVGSGSGASTGDQDMSGSNNVQSYMPSATPQQASQKSSMVSLAEQLAPGAQFNKLVSFPFSLSNNDDPNKEGRYKLHIPFLNQHVKRSDQQQVAANNYAAAQQRIQQQQMYQQQAQQYLNNYNQQYLAAQPQQQQSSMMMAQSSQLSPTIVSPQSSILSPASQSASAVAQSASPASSQSSSAPASQQTSVNASPLVSSSSSSASVPSVSASAPQNPSSSSSVSVTSSVSSSNPRPNWSVADTSSKLTPIQSSSQSSQADVNAQN